jgi:isoleucyl-tRNA synthetase
MRAALAQREPARAAHWEKIGLYEAVQKRRGGPRLCSSRRPAVHERRRPHRHGPQQDAEGRHQPLQGPARVPDALRPRLGLPRPADRAEGRPRAPGRRTGRSRHLRAPAPLRRLSETWIAKQTAQFKRLGVLADWAHEYKTKAPAFEADILRVFAAFVEKGLVYRSKKPVYWSIPFETALAEAEIEYKEHSSPPSGCGSGSGRRGRPLRAARRQAPQHRHLDDDALDDPGQPRRSR